MQFIKQNFIYQRIALYFKLFNEEKKLKWCRRTLGRNEVHLGNTEDTKFAKRITI